MKQTQRRDLIPAVFFAVLRVMVLFVVIAVLYVLSPLENNAQSSGIVVALVVLTILYSIYFYFQLRGVRNARHPGVRATEAIISSAFLFLAMFGIVYTKLSIGDPTSFTEELTPFSGLYFAVTVFATVGFGDITPTTVPARAVTMLQMALGLAFLGVVVRVFATAAKGRKGTNSNSEDEAK